MHVLTNVSAADLMPPPEKISNAQLYEAHLKIDCAISETLFIDKN